MNPIINELPKDLESICKGLSQNRNYALVKNAVQKQMRTTRKDPLNSILRVFDLVRGYVNKENSLVKPELAEFLKSLTACQLKALIVMLLRDSDIICFEIQYQMENYISSGLIFSRKIYNSYGDLVAGLQKSVITGKRFDVV